MRRAPLPVPVLDPEAECRVQCGDDRQCYEGCVEWYTSPRYREFLSFFYG